MKKHLLKLCIFIALILAIPIGHATAQCGAGTTRDTLNWDYLDFIPNSGTYVSPIAFVSLAQSQAQKFTFGKQYVSINHNYSGTAVGGDQTTHTGETGSFGKGADVRFRGNGSVTITFTQAVQSMRFSLHDVDYGQALALTATNSGTPTAISATTLAGSILTVTGSGTSAVTATASSTAVGNSANTPASNGTLNIDISGPVTSVTLNVIVSPTTTGEDGSYFISDISACSAGTFPLNYYYVSKPFTGQPSYFLAVRDNQIYYVNVANGVARLLFQDNGHTNINSLAYDPYRHMVYYAFSLTTNSQADKKIYRFDYNMDTMGVFINNVNTIGIPTFQTGVESGAAGFYDGAYFMGVEGNDQAGANSNRESIIWRVDLDTVNYLPTNVAQVWATPVDDGAGTSLHDWSDVGFNDGIMYDFDGASGQTDFYHKNLLTGECTRIAPSPSSLIPRQVSVTWAGQMYNSGSPSSIASGTLVPYNGNGTVNTPMQRTMTYQGVAVAGSWGDAGEAFKPKTDFGDAPDSYDPPGVDPGTHERNDSIRLGSSIGIEWSKKTSSDASGDGPEEDGVTGFQIVPAGINNFYIPVQVYNRTNRNATLAGWIDANGNGVYDVSEGTTMIVTPSASMQTVNLSWTSMNIPLPAYSTTFMRLRIATVNEGMTVAKPNGYFDNGEIEDHQVTVSQLLPDQSITLQAQKNNGSTAYLLWYVNNENGNSGYELQRSCNGRSWTTINSRATIGGMNAAYYTYMDSMPCTAVSYYRVKLQKSSGAIGYSEMKKVDFRAAGNISVTPNPAKGNATLTIQSPTQGMARINVIDFNGRIVMDEKMPVNTGNNDKDLPIVRRLGSGSYKVRVQIEEDVYVTTMVVVK